jgi:hypothetical protein
MLYYPTTNYEELIHQLGNFLNEVILSYILLYIYIYIYIYIYSLPLKIRYSLFILLWDGPVAFGKREEYFFFDNRERDIYIYIYSLPLKIRYFLFILSWGTCGVWKERGTWEILLC